MIKQVALSDGKSETLAEICFHTTPHSAIRLNAKKHLPIRQMLIDYIKYNAPKPNFARFWGVIQLFSNRLNQ